MASLKTALAALKRFRKAYPLVVTRAMRAGLRRIQGDVLTRYMQRGVYYPSQPSRGAFEDPPNPPPGPLKIRSGDLARTVTFRVERTSLRIRGFMLAGSASVRYAAIHEYGGVTGRGHRTLIRPRPYVTPAIEARIAEVRAGIEDAIRLLARQTLREIATVS